MFKTKLGLLVDFPKACGSGTSNDGNTSRRAFAKSELFSSITGVDSELIQRIHIILLVINSFYKISLSKYENFCSKIFDLYVQKYPWFYKPAYAHKILIHSHEIIANLICFL